MGRPTQGGRVARLAEKLTPRRWVSGFVTSVELEKLRAAGIPGCVALRPEPMTPEVWSSAVQAHHAEMVQMARHMTDSIRERSDSPLDADKEPDERD